jgi:hypothetical protein
MGVEDNQFQISNLNANTSFFDWYTKTNDEVIAKLNKLKLYELDVAGSLTNGISAEVGTSGGHTSGYLNLGVSDTIPHKLLIQGDVCTTGSFCYKYTVSPYPAGATLGITNGNFVCLTDMGGITLSSASQSGVTTSPFHKNETIGVVENITGNTIKVVNSGLFTKFSGLTSGQAYYLDPTVMGGITLNIPSTAGQTKKRLVVSLSATEGIIEIGDSEIVS